MKFGQCQLSPTEVRHLAQLYVCHPNLYETPEVSPDARHAELAKLAEEFDHPRVRDAKSMQILLKCVQNYYNQALKRWVIKGHPPNSLCFRLVNGLWYDISGVYSVRKFKDQRASTSGGNKQQVSTNRAARVRSTTQCKDFGKSCLSQTVDKDFEISKEGNEEIIHSDVIRYKQLAALMDHIYSRKMSSDVEDVPDAEDVPNVKFITNVEAVTDMTIQPSSSATDSTIVVTTSEDETLPPEINLRSPLHSNPSIIIVDYDQEGKQNKQMEEENIELQNLEKSRKVIKMDTIDGEELPLKTSIFIPAENQPKDHQEDEAFLDYLRLFLIKNSKPIVCEFKAVTLKWMSSKYQIAVGASNFDAE